MNNYEPQINDVIYSITNKKYVISNVINYTLFHMVENNVEHTVLMVASKTLCLDGKYDFRIQHLLIVENNHSIDYVFVDHIERLNEVIYDRKYAM